MDGYDQAPTVTGILDIIRTVEDTRDRVLIAFPQKPPPVTPRPS
jgi:hypothetical protein